MGWWIILTVLVLLAISYEDFKNRSVNVFLFAALASLLIYSSLQRTPLTVMAIFTGLNILYVILLLVVCCGYLYFKYRRIAIFEFIGLGDILFFLVIAMWFSPVNFIFFNTITFMGGIALHFSLSRISAFYKKFNSVPLAGFQSMCFAGVLLYTKIG